MNIDTGYLDVFKAFLAGESGLRPLLGTRGMKAIRRHADLTGNAFEADMIIDALNGEDNPGYGLRNLDDNLHRIRGLMTRLPVILPDLLESVEREVQRLFPGCDLSGTVICPVIGYDIGIGVDRTICLNLNNPLFLEDPDELISLAVHETAHTVFEQLNARPTPLDALIDAGAVLRFAEYLIHYEGVGLIAAADYRRRRNLPSGPYPTTEDYATSPERLQYFLENYHNLFKQVSFGARPNELLELIFNGERLVHRLGYDLFARIEEEEGFEAVRQAALMPTGAFTERYLRNNPWYLEPEVTDGEIRD